MGTNSARVFPPPTSYGVVQSPGTVSEVTPQGIAPSTVLLSDQAGGTPTFNPATPAPKKPTVPKNQKPGNLYIGPDYQPVNNSKFF